MFIIFNPQYNFGFESTLPWEVELAQINRGYAPRQ
jgi:hypothetical protein